MCSVLTPLLRSSPDPSLEVVLAFLTDPPVVRRILEHLDLPSVAPRLSPARADDTVDLWPSDHEERTAPAAGNRRHEPRRLPPRAPP